MRPEASVLPVSCWLWAAEVSLAFVDRDECGLFEPEPQQRARLQVDDRIVNGYKVRKVDRHGDIVR